MEDYLAALFVFAFLLGYIGISVGVGIYASKRGWSFLFFFLLALFLNPVLVFVGVVVLNAVVGNAGTITNLTSTGGERRRPDQTGDRRASMAPGSDVPTAEENEGPAEVAREAPSSEETSSDVSAGEPPFSDDTSSASEYTASEEETEENSLDETYDLETSDRTKEGKVRCDTCYSFVDESATECPACGADLDSGGFFE